MTLQIGKTKVFLRAGQMAELDARRTEVLSNAARIMQRRILTHMARKRFLVLRVGAICLQTLSRGKILLQYTCSCVNTFWYISSKLKLNVNLFVHVTCR